MSKSKDEIYWQRLRSVATKCDVPLEVVENVLYGKPVAANVNLERVTAELIEAKLRIVLSVTP